MRGGRTGQVLCNVGLRIWQRGACFGALGLSVVDYVFEASFTGRRYQLLAS